MINPGLVDLDDAMQKMVRVSCHGRPNPVGQADKSLTRHTLRLFAGQPAPLLWSGLGICGGLQYVIDRGWWLF